MWLSEGVTSSPWLFLFSPKLITNQLITRSFFVLWACTYGVSSHIFSLSLVPQCPYKNFGTIGDPNSCPWCERLGIHHYSHNLEHFVGKKCIHFSWQVLFFRYCYCQIHLYVSVIDCCSSKVKEGKIRRPNNNGQAQFGVLWLECNIRWW